jgi:DNA-binding XRE family transcriptional regulator
MTGITKGVQIRAGRALLGWSRADLARAAGLHRNSVAYWERETEIPLSAPYACELIAKALLPAGVEAFSQPTAGARFRRQRRRQINSALQPISHAGRAAMTSMGAPACLSSAKEKATGGRQ